jgi:PmbA protein
MAGAGPDLAGLTAALLDAARAAGADAADALAVHSRSAGADVRGGRLELAEGAESVEAGLRVLAGRRQAVVAASDLRPAALRAMAERAVAMAREAPEDLSLGLAEPGDLAARRDARGLDLDDAAAEPAPGALEAAALEAEAAARAIPGVTQVDSASAGFSRTAIHLAASNGFAGGYARTAHSLSCVAISGEGLGMERDHAHEQRVFAADLPDPASVGRLAGERAAAREGARRPPGGRVPVLFDERIAASLIGHLIAAVDGAAITRGASWLRDALGTQILPRGLSLTEDPLRPRGPTSRPFDAEGLACRPRAIVADGVLTGWTLDLGTGRRLGMGSTANAARGTAGAPAPSVTNLELTPGTASRAGLIREMGRGLLVTSLIGSTINPTTGDYSRGASGFWIEGGEIAFPVNECTVAGNLRGMLAGIVAANDARAHLSRRVPSLLIPGLTVAGA